MADITVGLVQRRDKHPDADKLSVCTVDVGAATRCRSLRRLERRRGAKVAVATAGTHLPGDLKIKKSRSAASSPTG